MPSKVESRLIREHSALSIIIAKVIRGLSLAGIGRILEFFFFIIVTAKRHTTKSSTAVLCAKCRVGLLNRGMNTVDQIIVIPVTELSVVLVVGSSKTGQNVVSVGRVRRSIENSVGVISGPLGGSSTTRASAASLALVTGNVWSDKVAVACACELIIGLTVVGVAALELSRGST